MKILLDGHLLYKNRAGMERYWKNLILELSNITKKDNLCVYLDKPSSRGFKFASYKSLIGNGFFRLFLGFTLAVLKEKPDLLHVNFFTPLIKNCPLVTTIHDICFITHPELFNPVFSLFAYHWLRRSIELSDAIICPSVTVKKEIAKIYGVEGSKIFVTYEAPDPKFRKLTKGNLKEKPASRFGIRGKFFLVPAGLNKRNNPRDILEVFMKLVAREDVELIFTGKNEWVKEFNYYKRLAPKNSIKYLGYIDDEDLNELYNWASAIIYLSKYEGFGLPIIEAMKCGSPVICSNLEVFKEVAGGAAIFIKDKNDLYKAMKQVITDKTLSKNYMEKGYRRSRQFSWQKTAEETIAVYSWVLKRQGTKMS